MKKKDEKNNLTKGKENEHNTISTNTNLLFSKPPGIDAETSNHMASSIDRLKDFDRSKQNLWLKYSEDIINDFCALLPEFPKIKPKVREDIRCPEEALLTQVGCAYAFLASKRREVAKLLKHGPLRHQFGLFNKPGFASIDDFNLSKDIPSQKDKIYEYLSLLISQSNPFVEVKQNNREAEGFSIYTITFKMKPDEIEQVHIKNLNSNKPFIENDTVLTITFNDYGKNDNRTSIVIDHCPTPFAENYTSESSYFKVQFELIEPYFQACLVWEPSEGMNQFLENAGKIAYILARMQPVGRGNSAIVEWMIRGLAQTKNIELGPFNPDEKIGWDFKAFLTPQMQDYAHWFSEKAFAHSQLKNVSSLEY
ncbi:TPA: hypothetical protein F8R96_04525 [Legionella pneumophila]|nr:hypothetical protein [Legionella pneumophila]HBI2945827.1 hypothetical protein [Legionella pneumophila]